MPLNPKQEKFCQLYHQTGNASQSYKDAGYSAKTDGSARTGASTLLTNPNIEERLATIAAETAKEVSVSRSEMLGLFLDIATAEGIEETRDRISAGKEINRMCGYYEPDKVEVSGEADLLGLMRELTGAKDISSEG